jgi:hypothetical protein
MVDYLEILRGDFAIGIFLNIEGAFNNLHLDGILESLGRPCQIIKLVKKLSAGMYSEGRISGHNYKFSSCKRHTSGVLSLVLWNLAFKEVLKLFDSGPIKVCGNAYDFILIGYVIDPASIVGNLQQSINWVLNWGHQRSLKFSASKPVAVTIMWRRKWHCP